MGLLDAWRFCPACGAAIEEDGGRATCPACGFVAYANSAPTANALCVDDEGRVLLCRRAIEPAKGLWDIPGGFLEEGEHPLDGLRRELWEETGLEVVPGELLCITVDDYGEGPGAVKTLNLTWLARIGSGDPAPADDVGELRWFPPDELPGPGECAFETVHEVLRAWRQQDA